MKMGPIHPRENEYFWRDADSIVAFAKNNHLKIRGHNLCWHNQAPRWIFTNAAGDTVSKEILLQRLKEHITTVFIDAGGWETLKVRALARAPMSEVELASRYERYLVEVASKDIADIIIDNTANDFALAKKVFCDLVLSLKNRVYAK